MAPTCAGTEYELLQKGVVALAGATEEREYHFPEIIGESESTVRLHANVTREHSKDESQKLPLDN